MPIFLSVQSTYDSVECCLYRDQADLEVSVIAKEQASLLLLDRISAQLNKHSISLHDLNFIAANQGPAPFTTLRTVIATVNGLSFATKVPLVGVDGLEVLLGESVRDGLPVVALLNAFNKAVYYGLADEQGVCIQRGYAHLDVCLNVIKQELGDKPFLCVGNAALLYRDQVQQIFPAAIFSDPMVLYSSVRAVATRALALWQQGKTSSYLAPLYLKKSLET